jgi:hypothetical protein
LLGLLGLALWNTYNAGGNGTISETKLERKQLRAKLASPIWEWFNYSSNAGLQTGSSDKLLIAQFSGFGGYTTLLNVTSLVNRAYARIYRHDYVILRGITFLENNVSEAKSPPESRATYNKISILLKALESCMYDKLLLLDSDAMIVDFSRKISDMIPTDTMLVAHKVDPLFPDNTWNINAGVMLWNLRHPKTHNFAIAWSERCMRLRVNPGLRDDDQLPLQYLLWKLGPRARPCLALRDEFGYENGRTIKHFKRRESRSWTDVDDTHARSMRIESIAREVCQTNAPACEGLTEWSPGRPPLVVQNISIQIRESKVGV